MSASLSREIATVVAYYRSDRRPLFFWSSGPGMICWPRCSQYSMWNLPRVTCAASASPVRSLARRPAVRSQARRCHEFLPVNASMVILGVCVRSMRTPYRSRTA
ncbi:MAG TPA: hypothetical protein VEU07_14910, partial [Candidatus Acidoferrum sp.]|nr:hypothetical protein [Candidatus Acidoferrum sp.]